MNRFTALIQSKLEDFFRTFNDLKGLEIASVKLETFKYGWQPRILHNNTCQRQQAYTYAFCNTVENVRLRISSKYPK